MGMNENTVAEPIMRCERPTQTTNRQARRCSNKNCKNHNTDRIGGTFCPTCGEKIQDYPIPEPMSIWNILAKEDIDPNKFYVIQDDQHNIGSGITVLMDNGRNYVNKDGILTAEEITDGVNYFNSNFKNEINVLKKYYESVRVDFMLFTFYS